MYRGPLYTVGEVVLGVTIAALVVISVGVGFLAGARDVGHYMRIRKI
jgi:hypothetical protein